MRIEAFLEESPLFAVISTAQQFEMRITRVFKDDELNFLQALILAAIFFETPRPVRPSSLAETFSTTRGNVSHCISALEAKGLLLRKIDPEDARAYRLTLKPHGKRIAVRVIGVFDRLQRGFESGAGKTALRQMLTTLRDIDGRFAAWVTLRR